MSEPFPVPPEVPADFHDIARTQQAVQDAFLAVPSVVGVALGHKHVGGQDTGNRAIVVLVEKKVSPGELRVADIVPPSIDGTPIDVQAVGKLRAGPEPLAAARGVSLTRRTRPVTGGMSIGHHAITAGTVATGCYAETPFPSMPGRYYLLSNNHVLANSNDAQEGDAILQPGPFDGGTLENDKIGTLAKFIPIKFLDGSNPAPTNEVDAAIAEVDLVDIDRSIHWVGELRGCKRTPEVGLLLAKCGRTTGFTTGQIVNINATVDVNYGKGRIARFVNQLVATNMSAPGDSGSLVADLHGNAVGLLFAGSAVATIVNPITTVERLLGVKVVDG